MSKVISPEEAASKVKSGQTLMIGGFVGNCVPEELLIALKERYIATGEPKGLLLVHASGIGDGKTRGINHMAQEGLCSKIFCAHMGLAPMMSKLAMANKIAVHMVPQGIGSHMMRAIAGKRPGVVSHVGLKTFIDPRLEGGKANDAAKNDGWDHVQLIEIGGKEYLFYPTFPLDVCFIKVSYADTNGNLSVVKEASHPDHLSVASAVYNNGGLVIAQADEIVDAGTIHPRDVVVHGMMVSYVVKGKPENNRQTFLEDHFRPEVCGDIRIPMSDIKIAPLDARKIIGRRGALELSKQDRWVNLGIGIPDMVAQVAGEEGIAGNVTLSIESGVLGGVPLGGVGIGSTVNPQAIYRQESKFDLYDGGAIDICCLGAAEISASGDVNVSKFGGRVVGPGGFINISQNAKKACFCGTFCAKSKIEIKNGKLNILEDSGIKFINKVEQVTFSGEYANQKGQPVLYLTERAIFKLTPKGIMLIEIAPGVDLEKHILANMEFKPLIADDLKEMDSRIFLDQPMGLKL